MKGRDRLFLLVALFAAAHFLCMRFFWDIAWSPIRGSDFSSYYTAGLLVREGRAGSLYEVGEADSILGDATTGPWKEAGASAGVPRQHYYIYPPLFALAAAPLSFLSYGWALNAWLALDLILLAGSIAIYAVVRRGDLTAPEQAFVAATCLFEFLPLIWAMAVGQTSLLVLFLLAATLLAWKKGTDPWAGVFLGLATAIKLTPALIVLFFWWRGRPRIAFTAAAVFAATQAISIAALGWEAHATFYFDVMPEMAGGTCYFLNQSLGAFFNRLLTDGDVTQVALTADPFPRILSALLSAALLAACAPRLRREAAGVAHGDELQFGAVILLTLIVSPVSWTHHYLIALLPIWAVAAHLGKSEGAVIGRAAILGLAWLLIARKPHPDLFLHGVSRIFNSGALAGAALLLGLCLFALRARRGEEAVRPAIIADNPGARAGEAA